MNETSPEIYFQLTPLAGVAVLCAVLLTVGFWSYRRAGKLSSARRVLLWGLRVARWRWFCFCSRTRTGLIARRSTKPARVRSARRFPGGHCMTRQTNRRGWLWPRRPVDPPGGSPGTCGVHIRRTAGHTKERRPHCRSHSRFSEAVSPSISRVTCRWARWC